MAETVALNTEHKALREFVSLLYQDGRDPAIPFAFFLCSESTVVVCRIGDAAGECGHGPLIQKQMDDAVDILIDHLIDDERPTESDIQIVQDFLRGPGHVKLGRNYTTNSTEDEFQDLLLREVLKVGQEFDRAWYARHEKFPDFDLEPHRTTHKKLHATA
jgi:hypothetical protein